MRIAILCGTTGWHVQDVLRAANERGHRAEAFDFRHLAAEANGSLLAGFDAALVRIMPYGSLEQVVFRMDVLHAAAANGVKVLNPPRAIETCVDKYLTNVRLASAGLPMPPTHVAQRAEDALEAFEQLGRDVVLKPLFGSEGRGMQRVSDRELAWRTFHVLERTGQVIYQQTFVRHPGWDLRAFVIGGRVLAAMRRTSNGDWRTNVAQGGKAERVVLSVQETDLALCAAAAVGCIIAGVDLLPGPNGERYVIEVNAVPGWRALGEACGLDVAAEVVRFLAEEFPAMTAPPRTETLVQTACIWEVMARKLGNVHPRADFPNTSCVDFLVSAAAISPYFLFPPLSKGGLGGVWPSGFEHDATAATQTRTPPPPPLKGGEKNSCAKLDESPLGQIIALAVTATHQTVGQNTNLGIILLLVPLAHVDPRLPLANGLLPILQNLTRDDARLVYQAIRFANPGGLGHASEQDVHAEPTVTLLEAMKLAADRDMIARQYANNFADVLDFGVPAFLDAFARFGNVEAAIIDSQFRWLAAYPDSLIARKNGSAVAEDVRCRAAEVLKLGGIATPEGRRAGTALDRHLRADGHKLNPGTTADLIAACLFVALRENKVVPSAPFRWDAPDWLTP